MALRNLIVCGFMGSGKSTLGPLLARRLGKLFIDLDHYIEIRREMSIPQIFQQEGEEGFRDEEHAALCDLLRQKNFVIGAGGGTLSFQRNLDALGPDDRILLLDPGFDACWARIEGSDRPLVVRHTREELAEIYRQRMVIFRRAAHGELDTDGDLHQVVEKAALALEGEASGPAAP